MVTSFLWGVTELRTVKDMEEGGVKKPGKSGDILYGQPLTIFCFASSKSLLTYVGTHNKMRRIVSSTPKMVSFFTAGKKGVIFGTTQINILPFLFCQL